MRGKLGKWNPGFSSGQGETALVPQSCLPIASVPPRLTRDGISSHRSHPQKPQIFLTCTCPYLYTLAHRDSGVRPCVVDTDSHVLMSAVMLMGIYVLVHV